MSDNEFKQRVLAWAKIINVKPKEIHIRKMTKSGQAVQAREGLASVKTY